jgi:hypothetical protein
MSSHDNEDDSDGENMFNSIEQTVDVEHDSGDENYLSD